MAETYQKVFIVLVRPYFMKDGKIHYHKGHIYNDPGYHFHGKPAPDEDVVDIFIPGLVLSTDNISSPMNTPNKINTSGAYEADPWFIHSTYTSYDDLRASLLVLMDTYGFENLKCCIHVPVDFIPLPREKKKRKKDL
jgi:hypothetical protein